MSSIFMQKINCDYEIVISEDYSTDGTKEIIQRKYACHPKVRVIYNEENLGIRRNYINILPQLKGEYYTVLDPDDYWIGEEKIQHQINFLDCNPEFAAVAHNTMLRNLDGSEQLMISEPLVRDVYSITDFVKGYIYFHTSSIMYKNIYKSMLVPSFFKHKFGGDTCRMLFNAQFGKVKYIDEVSSCYTIHGSGVWSDMTEDVQLQNNVDAILFYKRWFNGRYNSEFCEWYVRAAKLLLSKSLVQGRRLKYRLLSTYYDYQRINEKLTNKSGIKNSIKKNFIYLKKIAFLPVVVLLNTSDRIKYYRRKF